MSPQSPFVLPPARLAVTLSTSMVLMMVVLMLAGCSGSSDQAIPPPSHQAPAPSSGQASSQVPAPAQQAQAPQDQTPQGQAPLQTSPAVAIPPSLYTPTALDVQTALTNTLAATIVAAPPSPARDQWAQREANRLQTLQVTSCTSVPAGIASQCQIRLEGVVVNIKMLLTTTGWQIVQ